MPVEVDTEVTVEFPCCDESPRCFNSYFLEINLQIYYVERSSRCHFPGEVCNKSG